MSREQPPESSEARFRGLLESAPDSIVIVDDDGRIAIVNRQVEQAFGYGREELIGQPFEVLIPERFRERHVGHRHGYMAAPHTRPMGAGLELYARRKDGSEFPVEISLSPLETPDGMLVTSIVRDISERKQADRALRESERRFHTIFDHTFGFVGLLSLDGTLIEANETALQFAGVSREEVVGRPFWETRWWANSAENQERLRSAIAEAAQGAFVRYEVDNLAGDGKTTAFDFSIKPIRDESGEVVLLIPEGRAISDRKEAEEQLRRTADEVERSNVELEQFAQIASHDLQEPLRMVASYTQLLARRYKGQLDADADEFIGYAVDGATRMHDLINDLLAYSRVGTHGRPFDLVDVDALVDRILVDLSLAIEESGLTVQRAPLPVVVADPIQLGQLLQNLISNAIKFRGERAPKVEITAERQGGEWRFAVRDNGIGIAPEYAERVFIVFQRLHTRAEYPGTGIGLAICRKIVARHGGRTWVESQLGKGSTFYFTIPARGEGRQ